MTGRESAWDNDRRGRTRTDDCDRAPIKPIDADHPTVQSAECGCQISIATPPVRTRRASDPLLLGGESRVEPATFGPIADSWSVAPVLVSDHCSSRRLAVFVQMPCGTLCCGATPVRIAPEMLDDRADSGELEPHPHVTGVDA